MNKKQKVVLSIALVLIAAALVVWISHGTEVLTKTQVQVETTSELDKALGIQNFEWQDELIIGLDYAGGFSAIVAVLAGILFFIFRTKKYKEIQ